MTVTTRDMMIARDKRANLQSKFAVKYSCVLVSYTLNIAGPLKRFERVDCCFYEGKREIEKAFVCGGHNVFDYVLSDVHTGLECLWALSADAYELKIALTVIEEQHPIGRLFDIDVIKSDGEKISRCELNLAERSCLVCGKPGHGCARSRAHPLDEIIKCTHNIIDSYYTEGDK